MGKFKSWLENHLREDDTALTSQQEEQAAQVFSQIKKLFAGEFQNIKDVAHMPLDKQSVSKEPNQPPTSGMRSVLNKLEKTGIFKKASQISPDFAKRVTALSQTLTSQMNDQKPNPSMTVGKLINMLFGRDDAIQYYGSGMWKQNSKRPDNQQPPMQLTPPPQKPTGQGITQPDAGNLGMNPANQNMQQPNSVPFTT